MNPLQRRQFLGLSLGFASAPSILTAAAPPASPTASPPSGKEELLKNKKVEIFAEQTPDFTLKGATKEKRFKAKDWLVLEFEWDVEMTKLTKDKDLHFYDDISIKYYVYLAPTDVKKQKLLMADISYANVPIKETIHSAVYISPSTIFNITGDKLANKQLVSYYGAVVTMGGSMVGRVSSVAGSGPQWWESPKLPAAEEGRLLPKLKTPFAPLWYDYYMEEKTDK